MNTINQTPTPVTTTDNQAGEIKRPLFTKTTKSLNHIGISLMWFCIILLSAALLIKSALVGGVCFVVFALSWLFYQAAERNGGIFEFLPIQPNHRGRLAIFLVWLSANAAGFLYLDFVDSQATPVFVVMLIATGAIVTAIRFVGIHK